MRAELLRTPLAASHEALGARMVPFSGWLMPIQYEGIVAEHLHARASAGLFDLSHMGRLSIEGREAADLVQQATTNDIRRLTPGGAQYSLLCNDDGGVIDDLLVYRLEADWQLVVNAANRERVTAHLGRIRNQAGLDALVADRTFDTALIGLQGPASEAVLHISVLDDLLTLGYYRTRSGDLVAPSGGAKTSISALLSRTGYTGEDGFEVQVAAAAAALVWSHVLTDPRVKPVGLGARDTLRLEAGMCLYGHELDETVTPYEVGLGRVVRLDKGPFVGRDALSTLSQQPARRKLVGLRFGPGAVPRTGCVVTSGTVDVGEVASGSYSPTLHCPIATAFVRPDCAEIGTELAAIVRGAAQRAQVVSLPFVPHRTKAQAPR